MERVRLLERRTGRIVPFLFPHLKGKRVGERIRDFQKAWRSAYHIVIPGDLQEAGS